MVIKYEKVRDKVYAVDTNNPLVYRNISGYDFANAPSNAVKTGSNTYNTPENIEMLKKAEEQFAKQKIEQEMQAQIEAKKSQAQKQAEAQAQVKSVPHVTSPEYHEYLESQATQEQKKKIAENIAGKIAPTIANTVIGKMIEKIKKETIEIPATREARIDEAMYQITRQAEARAQIESGKLPDQARIRIIQPPGLRIATPISPNEVPGKKIEIAFAGGIASILARVGTALWEFIVKNPKTIGATISTTTLFDAITQTAKTEGEKNQIIREIAQQNPQLAREIAQTKTSPFSNIADMGKYAVLGIAGLILLYLFSKKTNL